MYEIEKYLEEIRNNISKVSNEVINSFNRIQNLKIPSDAKVLILSTPITVKYIKVTLFVNEDMFEPVDVEEHDGDISSIYRMTDEFFLYNYLGLKKNQDEFNEFYETEDAERKTIEAIALWLKRCLESSNFSPSIPMYYAVPDEDSVFNLLTGEWEDQEELEF